MICSAPEHAHTACSNSATCKKTVRPSPTKVLRTSRCWAACLLRCRPAELCASPAIPWLLVGSVSRQHIMKSVNCENYMCADELCEVGKDVRAVWQQPRLDSDELSTSALSDPKDVGVASTEALSYSTNSHVHVRATAHAAAPRYRWLRRGTCTSHEQACTVLRATELEPQAGCQDTHGVFRAVDDCITLLCRAHLHAVQRARHARALKIARRYDQFS